jgi:hypothetical protein
MNLKVKRLAASSPPGRSAEHSEAMRGRFGIITACGSPSSGAMRHLLPAGEKRNIPISGA